MVPIPHRFRPQGRPKQQPKAAPSEAGSAVTGDRPDAAKDVPMVLIPQPPAKKPKKVAPQDAIDDFWAKFTTKTPGIGEDSNLIADEVLIGLQLRLSFPKTSMPRKQASNNPKEQSSPKTQSSPTKKLLRTAKTKLQRSSKNAVVSIKNIAIHISISNSI